MWRGLTLAGAIAAIFLGSAVYTVTGMDSILATLLAEAADRTNDPTAGSTSQLRDEV